MESLNLPTDGGLKNNRIDSSLVSRLKKFGERVARLGASFAVCDPDGRIALLCKGSKSGADCQWLRQCGLKLLQENCDVDNSGTDSNVLLLGEDRPVLAAVLKAGGENAGVALIEPPDRELNCERSKSSGNIAADCEYLRGMLETFVEGFEAAERANRQTEMVGTELAQTYEELVLLHKLSSNMKVTESDASYLQMACDSLTDIVSVAGIAILLEKTIDGEKQWAIAAGSGLIDIDERMAVLLQNRLAEELESGKEALLDSEVDSPFKYEWPKNIRSIIAVPLYGKDRGGQLGDSLHLENSIIGLMVAINRAGKPDFDSTDAKLFNSVANGCAVFVENGRLFQDLKELFIGSLRALTSSIDAKDQYTRGHSERVAFISRWIAERLAEQRLLEEEQIHRVYLAGLLHDIGKVGIDESILRKKGKLTPQEIEHIRKHPSIGAAILSEIKQMRDIVPGVLYHHERVDGKGYPHGLRGDHIPMISKIVGLADGLDAMTSKRVYRDALTLEQALAEIEKGLGTQFDERIGKVFLSSDVEALWQAIQQSSDFMGLYTKTNCAEYGTVAVGALIK